MANKIYLAASFRDKRRMRALREELVKLGYEVTSLWIYQDGLGIDQFKTIPEQQAARRAAMTDMAGIDEADEFVLFTDIASSTGGFYVELGIALAKGKFVTIVGPRNNIFMYVLGIEHFPNSYQYLRAMEEAANGSSSRSQGTPGNAEHVQAAGEGESLQH